MSVTSLKASLPRTGMLLPCGQCERQNRTNLEEAERGRKIKHSQAGMALECRAFALQNNPGDV